VTTDELTKRARYMRNAAPQQFLDFYAAFAVFTAQHFELLVDTDINLQRAQGHAQMCKKIRDVLEGVKNG
jgi:hypothetical protein